MAKRFSDSEKWKKPFVRSLQAPYKLLWFYILDDCDHAGIWQVDMDVAELRIGEKIDWPNISQIFGEKVHIFDNEEKWFIPDFINFQYGNLNPTNRVHESVISLLTKFNLLEFLEKNKGLISPLQGAKDKDKDKDKDKAKEKEGVLGETKTENKIEEAEILETETVAEIPVDLNINEDEYAAAVSFFKSQSFYTISKKQHQLDDETIIDYFRRFYERQFAEAQMEKKRLFDKYKSQMELIKHFYSYIPYLKKTIAETTPKSVINGNTAFKPREYQSKTSIADQRKSERSQLNQIAHSVLLGAQNNERTG